LQWAKTVNHIECTRDQITRDNSRQRRVQQAATSLKQLPVSRRH